MIKTGIFKGLCAYNSSMLQVEKKEYYQLKSGQTIESVAEYFSVSPWLIVRENGLTSPPSPGQILRIPQVRGNEYVVQVGDSKRLLCGSEEGYERRNGTTVFYVGMRVWI